MSGEGERPEPLSRTPSNREMLHRTVIRLRADLGLVARYLDIVEVTEPIPERVHRAMAVLAIWSAELLERGRPPRPR